MLHRHRLGFVLFESTEGLATMFPPQQSTLLMVSAAKIYAFVKAGLIQFGIGVGRFPSSAQKP